VLLCFSTGTYAIRIDQCGRTLSQIINRSYSKFSSVDFWSKRRGWNAIEVICVKLATDDFRGVFQEDILEFSNRLWTAAVILLLGYALLAERDLSKSRRRQQEGKHKVE